MKNFILFFTLLCLHNSNSQSAQIKNVFVNNIAIPAGGSINFGTQSSITVRFTTQFTKQENLVLGEVRHAIGTRSDSGSYLPLITAEFLTLGIMNVGFTSTWEKTLYASDYSYTGVNYLQSKVEQTSGNEGNPPITWASNQVIINRTPIFSTYPSSINYISCGSNGPLSFTVNNSGLPSGSTISYNWNIGNGWAGTTSTSSNSITLSPVSGTVLPSNVLVTPIFNGIAQATLVFPVQRSPIASSATITGPTGICSGLASLLYYKYNCRTSSDLEFVKPKHCYFK